MGILQGLDLKILLTGATGFIGSYLLQELLKRNHTVIATYTNFKKIKIEFLSQNVKFVEFNLHQDFKENLFDKFDKPDMLIHLAWAGLPNYNELFHIENLHYHYDFIKNLVSNGLENVTVSGTCFEYGKVNGCLSENMPTNPNNSYAIAKDNLRKYIQILQKHYEFSYKWIRLFYMYGKGQSEKSLLSILEKDIKNGKKIFNMSGGEQLRDYLHIAKLSEYFADITFSDYNNEIINCCSGTPISIRNLVEKYLQEKGLKMELNLGYYPYLEHEAMAFWGDNKKIKNIRTSRE